MISSAFRWVRPSRRRIAQVGAAAAVACLIALALAGGAAAAGLGLLAIVAAGAAFQRPYLLGPLVAVLLPAGDRLDILVLGGIAPLEVAVGGGAFGYLARLATRREELRLGVPQWTFAAFLVFVTISTLAHSQPRELLFWGALGLVFHAVTTHLGNRRDARLLLGGLAAATLFEASFALFEYVDRWSDRFSLLGGAIVYPLPKGTLVHPNGLAQFLVLGGLLVLALALADDEGVVRRCGFVTAGAASLALVVTFSRASWIAFAAGACVYLIERKARVPVLIAGAVAVGGGAVLALTHEGAIGSRISSLFTTGASGFSNFRLELAERATRIVADNPLVGSGHFDEIGVYAGRLDRALHPHNLFLGLAVFFGIPAALAFAALVLIAIRSAWNRYRGVGARRHAAVAFLALLVALLVNGLFEYPFWSQTLTALVVLAIAAAVSGWDVRESQLERNHPDW